MTHRLKSSLIATFLILLGTGLVAHPVNATPLFIATWEGLNSEIFTVDSANGNATSVGFAGTLISGLTFSGPTLFGWGQDGSLYTINQSNGSATLVGASGFSGVEGGISAHPTDGFLYAADSSANQLLQINPSTGAGAVLGAFGSAGGDISGLTFIGTTLYGIDAGMDNLVTVNTGTGTVTVVGSLGINVGGTSGLSVGGLAYDGTQLFLLDQGGIFSVDIASGAATGVSGFSINLANRPIGGAAAIPEPSSLLLLASGLAGLAVQRRRGLARRHNLHTRTRGGFPA